MTEPLSGPWKKFIKLFQIFRFLHGILGDLLATVQQSLSSVSHKSNLDQVSNLIYFLNWHTLNKNIQNQLNESLGWNLQEMYLKPCYWWRAEILFFIIMPIYYLWSYTYTIAQAHFSQMPGGTFGWHSISKVMHGDKAGGNLSCSVWEHSLLPLIFTTH